MGCHAHVFRGIWMCQNNKITDRALFDMLSNEFFNIYSIYIPSQRLCWTGRRQLLGLLCISELILFFVIVILYCNHKNKL